MLTTASAIDGSTVRAFREVHGAPVHDYYGLTETTGICIAVPAGAEQIGAGTLGVPVGCEIRVVGEDGCPVGAGVVGELHVRGPNLMKGYLPGPTTGRVRVVDGWLHTGDLVRVREDGFVVLVGRCADFAKTRHGDLLHPGEVEDALERHPLVAEAGVCRYLAAAGEERLAAFVVPVAGARVEGRQLSRHVAEQLGERAVPGLVRVVPSLERDGSGEPDRDLLAGLLGREEES